MGEVKSSEVKYSTPTRIAIGGMFLTATNIEFPSSGEYPGEGKLELNKEKLGLPDSTPGGTSEGFGSLGGGTSEVGEIASTSATPLFAWTGGWVFESKTGNEEAKNMSKAFPATITSVKGKLFLRIIRSETAKKEFLEVTAAEKANAKIELCGCTIFCIGK